MAPAQVYYLSDGCFFVWVLISVVCFLYADDIALLSASRSGLQKMTDICAVYGKTWDITFNPQKSQVITFGGGNPMNSIITMSDTPVLWANKVKYLGVSFHC